MKFLKKHKEIICGSFIMFILFVVFPANKYIVETTSCGEQVWIEDMDFFIIKSVICLSLVIVLIFIGGLNQDVLKLNENTEDKINVKVE